MHHSELLTFRLVLVAVAMALAVSGARAQKPDAAKDQKHRAECRLAHQVLTQGQPADKRDWAVGKTRTCPSLGGEAIASELDRLRTVDQRTDELERVVLATSSFVDRRIVSRALDIASDAAAGTAARVQAIRVLSHQMAPSALTQYEQFVQPPSGPLVLKINIPTTGGFTEGDQPVTAVDVQQIAETLERVAEDGAAAPEVRNAAMLVAGTARAQSRQ